MKEVKTPKKPLAIYYAIVLLVLLVLNFVVVPWASERQIKEVDYGTFMSMTEEKNIGRVDIESNQILFTDKENTQVYKTGLMSDPNLTERLYDAGAQFSSEIVEQASPLLSFLASFVLPIVIFVALGNYMNKKLILPNIPYVFFVYLFDKVGQAVRLAPGADISAKILNITQGFSAAFENALPSVYPLDLLVGIVGAVIIRLIVYVKGKNAKKYRKGAEYGSARWSA